MASFQTGVALKRTETYLEEDKVDGRCLPSRRLMHPMLMERMTLFQLRTDSSSGMGLPRNLRKIQKRRAKTTPVLV